MDARELTEELRARAQSLGFGPVGITSADPLEEDGRRFESWLADGFAGEMAYLEREPGRRYRPHSLMPNPKSAISLALNYHQGCGKDEGPAVSRVARYAWGEDYHRVIEEKLASLVAFIEERGGRCARGRGDVDHGPILERALARRAGLGFIGKNTQLITREFGSWVFLAEIITDLELVPDPPSAGGAGGCGSCRLCLEACPTGALVAPYRLDARRCISYLTIEQKKAIPEPLRPRVGEWAFGCDVCQDVCPYNQRPVETREGRLRADKGVGRSLEGWPAEGDWKEKLASSALSRAKPKGLLRNLAVTLGNGGGTEDLPRLFRMLEEPEPLVWEHARWAIAEIVRRRQGPARSGVQRTAAKEGADAGCAPPGIGPGTGKKGR